MQEMPDKSVDLVLTDPPYGLGFPYPSFEDTQENLKSLLDAAVPEIIRIGKRVAITPGITNISLYPKPDWILNCSWNTTGSRGHCGYNQWMPVLFYGKDLDGIGKINGVLKSDSLFINGGGFVGFQRGDLENLHVCPKPVGIIKWLVARLSNPQDIVLDPFMGSGTTCVACKKLGRNFIGIEKEPAYVAIAEKRLEKVNNHKITDFFGVLE